MTGGTTLQWQRTTRGVDLEIHANLDPGKQPASWEARVFCHGQPLRVLRGLIPDGSGTADVQRLIDRRVDLASLDLVALARGTRSVEDTKPLLMSQPDADLPEAAR